MSLAKAAVRSLSEELHRALLAEIELNAAIAKAGSR